MQIKHLIILLFFIFILSGISNSQSNLSSSDSTYLWDLARDTWRCIDTFVAPETGFPYDSDTKPEMTNTTNIGLYLTSVCAAYKMGFITHEEAVSRARKVLVSLEMEPHWHGFFSNHLNVTGKTEIEPGASGISDFNKLPGGLIVVRQTFPELKESCTKLLDRIEWDVLYDSEKKVAYAGYDVSKGKVMPWTLGMMASDTRLACFLMIASGKVPLATWNNLNQEMDSHYGLSYMKPGWMGGGLFIHGICGIFLDERYTHIGKSMANFTYVEMLYSRDIGSPIWGWSSCNSPEGGYLGWGNIPHHVMTPHASVLAISYYPKQVTKNLQKLENMGARPDYKLNGRVYSFGFRDAIDIETHKATSGYLTSLDQSMLFLSLANYLKDGVIWKTFQSDDMVKNGLSLISDYQTKHPEYQKIYDTRDNTSLINPNAQRNTKNVVEPLLIMNSKDIHFSIPTTFISIPLNRYDLSQYNALSYEIKTDPSPWPPINYSIKLWGKENGGICECPTPEDHKKTVIIPFYKFGPQFISFDGKQTYWDGLITNWKNPKQLEFILINNSDSTNYVQITNLRCISLTQKELQNAAITLRGDSHSPISSTGLIDSYNWVNAWNRTHAEGTLIEAKSSAGYKGKSLWIEYDLRETQQWVAVDKEFHYELPENYEFHFWMKTSGKKNAIEFKLIDEDGSTFLKRFNEINFSDEWKEYIVKKNDLNYGWGGDTSLNRIRTLSFAISAIEGGQGEVELDELTLNIPYGISAPLKLVPRKHFTQTENKVHAYRASKWIEKMQSKNGLVKSYGNPEEDYAWTYDQALSILVLSRTNMSKATQLVEQMVKLQNPNGSWYDGYHVTTMKKATDNEWIGSISWVVYAICQYIAQGGKKEYMSAAKNGSDYLEHQQQNDGKLHVSTEGNLDAWWAFQATGNKKAADKIKDYLLSTVWDDKDGRFLTGTYDKSIYLDPQTWGAEFLRAIHEANKAKRALAFAHQKLKVTIWNDSLTGFDTAGPYTIWNEGTGQYIAAGGIDANFYKDELTRQQNSDGSIYHSPENLEKPGIWHVRWPSVAATAWYYFAQTGSPLHTASLPGDKNE